MTQANRVDVRARLAQLIREHIPESVVPAVYAYDEVEFGGNSPVITLRSTGSERAVGGFPSPSSNVYLDAFILVAYAKPSVEGSANILDNVEAALMDVIEMFSMGDGTVRSLWDKMEVVGKSEVGVIQLDDFYRYERISLKLRCWNSG